jgi:hypothetical protein
MIRQLQVHNIHVKYCSIIRNPQNVEKTTGKLQRKGRILSDKAGILKRLDKGERVDYQKLVDLHVSTVTQSRITARVMLYCSVCLKETTDGHRCCLWSYGSRHLRPSKWSRGFRRKSAVQSLRAQFNSLM